MVIRPNPGYPGNVIDEIFFFNIYKQKFVVRRSMAYLRHVFPMGSRLSGSRYTSYRTATGRDAGLASVQWKYLHRFSPTLPQLAVYLAG